MELMEQGMQSKINSSTEMNSCAIMQPTFLPWLGYFDMIDQVNNFIFYDDVQLAKRSWQVRNKIKTHSGELFLTIPVKKTKNRDELLISETEISYDERWQKKHLKNFESSYKKATHFKEVYSFIVDHYNNNYKLLSTFNIDFILAVSKKIGIETKFIKSSELLNIKGDKDIRLASICKSINSNLYLSAQGSGKYIEIKDPGGEIVKNAINLYYHFFEYPRYNQIHGDFISHMSIIDLLFNEGFDNALELIRTGRGKMMPYMEFRKFYLK